MRKHETDELMVTMGQRDIDALESHVIRKPGENGEPVEPGKEGEQKEEGPPSESSSKQLWIVLLTVSVMATSMIWLLANARGRAGNGEGNAAPVDLNQGENRRQQ